MHISTASGHSLVKTTVGQLSLILDAATGPPTYVFRHLPVQSIKQVFLQDIPTLGVSPSDLRCGSSEYRADHLDTTLVYLGMDSSELVKTIQESSKTFGVWVRVKTKVEGQIRVKRCGLSHPAHGAVSRALSWPVKNMPVQVRFRAWVRLDVSRLMLGLDLLPRNHYTWSEVGRWCFMANGALVSVKKHKAMKEEEWITRKSAGEEYTSAIPIRRTMPASSGEKPPGDSYITWSLAFRWSSTFPWSLTFRSESA